MANPAAPDEKNDPTSMRPDCCERVVEDIARRFEQTERIQRALFRLSSFANSSADLNDLYRHVHETMKDLTSAENLFIAVLDHDRGHLTFPYYIEDELTSHPYGVMDLETASRKAITSLIIGSRKLVHVNRQEIIALRTTRGIDPDVGRIPEDWLGVPLMTGEKLLGALVIQSHVKGFRYSTQDESMMSQMSQHIANALQRKQFTDSLTNAKELLESNNLRLKGLLSERDEIHKQLKHNANHDSLTDLPNRALLINRLTQLIKQSKNDKALEYAVLFLDLDRFKVVNDSLGHLVGDALLVEVGKRLRSCIRPSDMVARLGGDEFCVLLTRKATADLVDRVSRRILENLGRPMNLTNQRVVTSTSIGIAFGNADCQSAEDVLHNADTALYQAKAAGKSTFRIFDRSMREAAVSRLEMEQALRLAIEEDDITVCYQPIIDIKTRNIVAFEALARWNHYRLGNVPAAKFIPLAEEIHLLPRLTMSVLRQATNQVSQWRSEISGMNNLNLNVNVSRLQIEDNDFVQSVISVLDRANLPARNLTLEITESMLLHDVNSASQVVRDLHERNVGLALDDFGTGYSSLSCLNSLPLDELKIDLSFIANIVDDAKSHAIVQMIIAMAKVMGLQVVAEGVETEAQLQVLRDLGVQCAQGYLFGGPASATSVTRQLCQPKKGVVFHDGNFGPPQSNAGANRVEL